MSGKEREALERATIDWFHDHLPGEPLEDHMWRAGREYEAALAAREDTERPDGEQIKVEMDDGSWVRAIGIQRGVAEREGQMLCAYHELCWWADPIEWMLVRDTEQEPK